MLSTLIQGICGFPLLTNDALQVVQGSENDLREGKSVVPPPEIRAAV